MTTWTRADAETWLYREARLLDERRYDEWFGLWDRDGVYWIPANEDDYDPATHVSLLYKDWVGLRDRVERLGSGVAYAQSPPSRLRRLVSNVEVEAVADAPGLTALRSNFLLVELRRHVQDVFAGTALHTLRLEDGRARIVRKVVRLLDNDEPIDNLTFLL